MLKAGAADSSAAKPVCVVRHDVHPQNDRARTVLAINARYLGPQRRPMMVVRLPPATDPAAGLLFAVDGNPAYKAAIGSCTSQFCTAFFELKEEVLKQLLNGREMRVAFTLDPQGQVKVGIPLDGFATALDALQMTGS